MRIMESIFKEVLAWSGMIGILLLGFGVAMLVWFVLRLTMPTFSVGLTIGVFCLSGTALVMLYKKNRG